MEYISAKNIVSSYTENNPWFGMNYNMNIYKGGLYENMIGEALYKQGYDLYYYKRENSTLEQDFFVRNI